MDGLVTAAAARELAAIVESIEAAHHGKTVLDGLRCGFGERFKLMTDVVEEAGFLLQSFASHCSKGCVAGVRLRVCPDAKELERAGV